jgi:two-component system response regulator ResD
MESEPMSQRLPRKVLVVDDDRDTTELTAMVLESAGYQVLQAHSGRECLEKVYTFLPDLILLDIHMDDLGGWETLRILRVDEATRDLPVAMFTIRGEIRDKMQGLQDGATDYITKPFANDDLIERVDRIFAAREGGRRPA